MESISTQYTIPHTTIRLAMVRERNRPRFMVDGEKLGVEAAAKEYLRSKGWWVVEGSKISLFLSMLSANFGDSFFAQVCRNWIGEDADRLIADLRRHCEATISTGRISDQHMQTAITFMRRYDGSESGHKKASLWASRLQSLPAPQQMVLIEVYKAIGYFTKGIPDLFATKDNKFVYYEVKSEGDALRAEQYVFAEALLPRLPGSFQVLRVLDKDSDTLGALANPADKPT